MKLSARFLNAVGGVNSFQWSEQLEYVEGDGPVDLFFQLVDSTQDLASQGYKPQGRRYCPAAGATLQCVIDNIDDSVRITRSATQPFAQDPSIWKLTVLSTDKVRGTCALRLNLTEGGKVQSGRVDAAVLVASATGN